MTNHGSRLSGKIAIVTGAGASGPGVGTGHAMAVLFARQGAKVLLTDTSADNAHQTLRAIEQEGGEASIFTGDVTRGADCHAMVAAAVERFGGLHILVNNVGIPCRGTVVDVSEETLDRTINVNLKSMVLTSKHAVPAMIGSGGGAIINIASVDGIRAGMVPNIPYAVSKGGVMALTKCMAVHHGPDGIRTNCIAPGHIHTPMVKHLDEPMRELRRRAAPLGTEGTAWDVAWAAVFLASDEARWINGVVLPVDAGLLATTPLAALPFFRDGD